MDPEPAPGDPVEYIHAIRQNADHLLAVINDILDVSKIEAGEMRVERVECQPCRVISDIASTMRVRAAERGIGFEIVNEPPIPLTVRTDPTRLRQVLINLVGNAVKFTERGRVRLTMELTRATDESPLRLSFTVADTGIGMDAAALASLYRPFTQADTSITRRFGGTGLGLTISRHLARLLGGDIEVTSKPGVGSTFTFHIDPGPLDAVRMLQHCSEAVREEDADQLHWPATRLTGRILLVDDGVHNRHVLSIYLRHAGAELALAENGQVGCEKALAAMNAGTPFDLILMDMQMPLIDGYAATARLRRRGYTGPIIALTAHAMAGDRDKCLHAGCSDYLAKPVTRQNLVSVVARHLANSAIHASPVAARSASSASASAGNGNGNGNGRSDHAADADLEHLDAPDGPIRPVNLDDDVRSFLGLFLDELHVWVGQIARRFERRDRQALGVVLHNIKGSAGMYGYAAISDAAGDLLDRIRNNDDLDALTDPVERLLALLRRVDGYDAAKEK